MRHVASYGCVCVVPDLSFVTGDGAAGVAGPNEVTLQQAFDLRATVLAAYYNHLDLHLNSMLFADQLDLQRVLLVGHSTGAGAVLVLGNRFTGLVSRSYVLFGPYFGYTPPGTGVTLPNHNDNARLLVVTGTLDDVSGAGAMAAYSDFSTLKTLVTITGANHFGYSGLCQLDNTCEPFGASGTISRAGQQQTGAAYLAAALRYYALGDLTARPYLSGAERVEGLEVYGVTGIQVQSQGFGPSTVPTLPPTAGTHP